MILRSLKIFFASLISTIISFSMALAASSIPDKPQTATISLGAEFASGKYGTDSTTRSLYMPLIVTWFPTHRIDVGIEIPFIYQSSSNVTTDLYRNNQTVTATETVARGGPGGSGGSIMQQQSGSSTVTSGTSDSAVSGIGDIILRLGVIALFEDKLLPQIRPSLFVKVPTANSSDGLGTGEYDAGIGVEASKWFGDAHLLGEAFYTWQGKANGFGLKNYVSYTVGAGYQLTDNVKPMLMIKGASAPSTYSDYLLETRAKVIWSVTNTTSVDLFVSHGISDSSPDYGGGLAVIYSF